jgi:CheY-like chemotaxis protein/Tfp pilus assembly protein PilF
VETTSTKKKQPDLDKLYPRLKFLIVDDFESFRSSIRLMLSSFGAVHVDIAYSAEDALEKCRFNFYDIILCDFNLGEGKNGQQVLEALRANKRLKHIHLFIMVTAETAKDVVLGAREYQPDAYIAKPITRTVLEQRLGQLVTQQRELKQINKEIDLENYSKAISLCIAKAKENSRYASWCHQTLGQLYLNIGDIQSAINLYNSIISKREVPWAVLGLAHAQLKNQDYKNACENFESALRLNPNMVEAYDGLTSCYEALNQHTKAQTALETAVEMSPRKVLRHEKLGQICQKNQDISGAANSFRKAIRYGEHSIHEKADNYLNLGRCLSEQSEGDLSSEGKALANEAMTVLDELTHKFSIDENACLNATLIEARVLKGQDNQEAAKNKLHQAECMIEEENLSADVGLEFSKTLYSLGETDRAEHILIKLAEDYCDEPEIMSQIESQLDEPESLLNKKQAKKLNKTGIEYFEKGNLNEAAEAFKEALQHTPRHAALNLNLAQVAIKLYKDNLESHTLALANESISRIKNLPEQHNQFKRLKYLEKQLSKLNSNN